MLAMDEQVTSTAEESLDHNNTVASEQDDVSLAENIQIQATNISYEIEKIVESKEQSGKILYKARWVAHTWIPEDCLLSFQHLIDEFWAEQNTKSKDREEEECCLQKEVLPGDKSSLNQDEEVVMQESTENLPKNTPVQSEQKEEIFVLQDESTLDCSIALNLVHLNNSDKHTPAMFCPKCNQRFFLKSNLEVHVLFCDGKNKKSSLPQVDTDAQNAPDEAVPESQTYEYIPMDANAEETCVACAQRFPSGADVGSALADVTQLLAHSRKKIISDKVEVYECDECNREFLYKHPVQNTESTTGSKARVKPYKCSICNRSFEAENEMLQHEVKHTNTPSRYTCGTCNEKFVTRDALQEHYRTDTNSCEPRKCELCGREFLHANHLKRHMTLHAGIKPFVCSICGHEFNQKSDLYRHEKRHKVDGKLTCSKCSMEFNDVEKLREHVKTHKKDDSVKQTFKCDRCEKTFGRKSHFKRHQSIHDGVKPHTCDECGKSFNQRTDLKRHYTSHLRRQFKTTVAESKTTGQDLTICSVCNKGFPDNEAYLQHSVIHQKIMNTGVFC